MADLNRAIPEVPEARAETKASVNGRGKALTKLAILAAVMIAGVLVARLTPVGEFLTREGIREGIEWLRGSMWAPVLFIAIYALATALAIPGTILTLAGGALFGVFWGSVFNSIAANIGANLAFLISRLLGRDGVKALLGNRLDRFDAATENHGFRGLLTLRLIPAVPFNALNFGSGLTSISWPTYALATLIGILPGTIVYTSFADALLQGSQEASTAALVRLVLLGGALIFLSFLPKIVEKLRGSAVVLLLALTAGAAGPVVGQDEMPDSTTAAAPEATSMHDGFTAVLSRFVQSPRVDYAALRSDRAALDSYVATLGSADPSLLAAAPPNERLAFWINAYNACMLQQVIDHYPLEEAGGFFSRTKNFFAGRPKNSVWQIPDVFTRTFCTVAGEERSQDQIEHEILRPIGEPRIHFAINCAARSCPPLTTEAYEGNRLDAQLDAVIEAFIANPEHFEIDRDGDVLRLNKVLDWFGEDFGGPEGLKTFFGTYLEGEDRAFVTAPSTEVRFFDYDWALNDVRR